MFLLNLWVVSSSFTKEVGGFWWFRLVPPFLVYTTIVLVMYCVVL